MTKILISIFLTFLLFSCWWSPNTTEESILIKFKWNEFSIDIPWSWEIKDLTDTWSINLPNPKEWKIEMVSSAKEEKNWFINNIIVLSKDIDTETKINSYDFSKKNNPKDYKWYVYYYEDSVKDFVFNDWDKSRLYIFLAKYNKDNDKLKFIQTAKMCWEKKVFFLTMGLSLNINDTAKYEEIFRSFKCD